MTLNEALEMIAGFFEASPSSIQPETLREEITGWDSMGFLTLMAEFDDRFSIILTAPQLEKMKKVDDILQIMRDHSLLSE
jgi:acyl carrier protein